MAYKPEIQYVGQFYVHGTEAPKLDPLRMPKRDKKTRPQHKQDQRPVITLDPVALCGMVVAFAMLVTLAIGALQIRTAWQEYEHVNRYLVELKQTNSELEHQYRTGFDLKEIETSALGMGMIPATEVTVLPVTVTLPQPEAGEPWWEEPIWFLKGLFA